jgi:hypothetical protein
MLFLFFFLFLIVTGQCFYNGDGSRIDDGITNEASCTGSYNDRTWKAAVWMTSATTECAGTTCGSSDASTCCKPVPVDYSHVCESAANYLPNHAAPAGTCDATMAQLITSSVQAPLAGEDFSSAYDCTGKSDAIKTYVNAVAATLGCCGGNNNGKAISFLFLVLLIILR